MPDSIYKYLGLIGVALGTNKLDRYADPEYEGPDWKWIVGIASAIIGVLFVVVGFLISAGLNNNQLALSRIEGRQVEVIQRLAIVETQVKDHIIKTNPREDMHK